MADNKVDDILIEIQAPANDAKEGLETVKKSLQGIKNATKNIDIEKLKEVKDVLTGLKVSGDAAQNMEATGKGIKAVASSVKSLSSVDSAKLKEVVDAVSQIGQGLGNLGSNNKINIRIDSEGIKKATKPLQSATEITSTMEKGGASAKAMADNVTSLADAESKAAQNAEKAASANQKLDKSMGQENGAEETVSKIQDLINKIKEYKKTISEMETGKIKFDPSQYADAVRGIKSATDEFKRFRSSIVQTEAQVNQTKQAITTYANAFSKGFRNTLSLMKKVYSTVGKVTRSFADGAKKVGKFFSGITSGSKHSSKQLSGLAKKLATFTRLFTFMALRKMLTKVFKEIGDAFNLLAQYSDKMGTKFNQSASLLVADAKWLGRSIIAAFEPILNAVAPILDALVAKIVAVVNAINQLLSALTGMTTFTVAKKKVDNYAAGLDKAGKAAKELKKTVLGFDELNQLQDNKNNSGGGGSVNPADVFDTADIEDKWKKWADWIKSMWAKGDFSELGSAIGNWLLNALKSIPWTKIKALAYKLGKSFATLLNNIFETPELGKEIGNAIAQAINTGVLLANGFIRNFHWHDFGKFIGETFNGFFENIDWYYIKDTVVAGLRGLAIAIQNFIDTFNWDNISNTIINGLDTISAGIKAFFENINWNDLGKKMGDQIAKTLKGTNWKQVGEAIGDAIQAAIDWASGILDKIEVKDVVKALTDVFRGICEKVDTVQLGKTLGKLVQSILDIITGFFKENIGWMAAEFGGFVVGFLSEIDTTEWGIIIGGILTTALVGGIGNIGLTVVKKVLTDQAAKWITAKCFSGAAETAIGGAVTEAAGSQTVATAAAGAGTSIGALLGDALLVALAAFCGQQVGTQLGKIIFPEDAELYEQYEGISGFFKEIGDLATSTADWVKMAWSGELSESNFFMSLSREEQQYYSALKVHWGENFPAYMQMNIDLFGGYEEAWRNLKAEAKGYYDETQEKLAKQREGIEQVKETMNHIYDTKAAEGFKTMQEHTESLKNSLDHIADSKARQAFADMHNLSTDTAKSFDDLASAAEKDASKIDNSIHICDTNAATSFKNMQNSCDALKSTTGNLSMTVEKDTGSISGFIGICDTKAAASFKSMQDNANKVTFQPLSNNVSTNMDATEKSIHICDTKAAEAFRNMTNGASNLDKNTSTSFGNIGRTLNTNKTVVESYEQQWAGSNLEISGQVQELTRNTTSGMEEIKGSVESSMADVNNSFDTVKDGMSEDKWTFSGVAEGLKKTFQSAKEAIKGIWNSIAETLNGEWSIGSTSFSINIPTFANGGTVPEDGLFMANHTEIVGRFANGRTAVANNEMITEGIAQAVFEAVTSAGMGNDNSDRPIYTTITLDGMVLARAVSKGQTALERRYSPTMV